MGMYNRCLRAGTAVLLLSLSWPGASKALDPSAALAVEPLLRAIDAGFEAIDSGARAISALVALTGTLNAADGLTAQRDLQAIRQDLSAVSGRLDELALALADSTHRIIAAIDESDQRRLFADAYALQRSLELRIADIASVDEIERDYSQIQNLRYELEKLAFRAEGMLRASRGGGGVHFIGALHSLAVSSGQIQAVLEHRVNEREGRSLRAINDTLARTLNAASSEGSALHKAADEGQRQLAAYRLSLVSNREYKPLLEDGFLATGMRTACFAVKDRFKARETTEEYEDCANVGILPIRRCKDRERQVVDYLTHYIETRFSYSLSSEDRAGVAFIGALRPVVDEASKITSTQLPSPDCSLIKGAPEDAWKSVAQDYNRQVLEALPDLQKATLAIKTIDLAEATRIYLHTLHAALEEPQVVNMN